MSKIGRNHRCPCGSGKKYKHCCLKLAQPELLPVAISHCHRVPACNDLSEERREMAASTTAMAQ